MQAGFNPIIPLNSIPIDPARFRELVEECAYYKSEKRGFIAGHETEDWLEAEEEIKNQCHHWFQEVE